jgi:protein TonB
MTPEWRAAIGMSMGLHAALLLGLPVTDPVAFDVERAPTSVELYLVAPPAAEPVVSVDAEQPLPAPEPVAQEPLPPAPQAAVSEERKGAEIDLLPGYLRNPPPVYPRLAREQGQEGTVLLEVEVLPSGRCGVVSVLKSSNHPALDEAAVVAVRRWVFRPAKRWRQPVGFWVEIPITFRLIEGVTP